MFKSDFCVTTLIRYPASPILKNNKCASLVNKKLQSIMVVIV